MYTNVILWYIMPQNVLYNAYNVYVYIVYIILLLCVFLVRSVSRSQILDGYTIFIHICVSTFNTLNSSYNGYLVSSNSRYPRRCQIYLSSIPRPNSETSALCLFCFINVSSTYLISNYFNLH